MFQRIPAPLLYSSSITNRRKNQGALWRNFLKSSCAQNVDTAQALERIACNRTVVGVVGVGSEQGHAAAKPHDDRRMIKIPRRPAKLHKIAKLQLARGNLFCKRSCAVADAIVRVPYKEIIKIFHARPRRRPILQRAVEPADIGGVIHHANAGEQALRSKVCAIAAQTVEIIILWIAGKSPPFRIRHGCGSVILNNCHATSYASPVKNVQKTPF